MPEFMDVHRGMQGVTPQVLAETHEADVAVQQEEGVTFKHAWADPDSGMVFCLSEAPSADAVQRVHTRAGHPYDEIHQVSLQVDSPGETSVLSAVALDERGHQEAGGGV